MNAIHPLPEPGTVEAFVVALLEGAAARALGCRDYAPRDAGVRFLRWLQMCCMLDVLDLERS